MDISVIICTCDRPASLARTLDTVAAARVPPGRTAEVLVVDNGSVAGIEALVTGYGAPALSFRYAREERSGKSFACNAAVAAARGGALLFTDDDVRVPPGWLAGLCEPVLAGRADLVAGGVAIPPHLERPWMTRAHRNMLAATEGLCARDPQWIVGANMAIARSAFEAGAAFDTNLGPGALGYHEEYLLYLQLRGAGCRVVTALDTVVEHHFDETRLERSHFLKVVERMARSQAYVRYHCDWRNWFPRSRMASSLVRLLGLRILGGGRGRQQGVSYRELCYVSQFFTHQQYLAMQGQPRRYGALRNCRAPGEA